MVQQLNAKEVKEKILNHLRMIGPSLPVQIAKQIGMNTLFTSAFLSELSSEKAIKISNMKVGGSPLYFIPESTDKLENFIIHLHGKEKEACILLKESRVLQDDLQPPAIRVALRAIKDFAIPFRNDERVFWRYFLAGENEINRLDAVEIKTEQKTELKKEDSSQLNLEIAKEEMPPEPLISKEEIDKIKQELEDKRKELAKIREELLERKEEREDMSREAIKMNNTKIEKKKIANSFLEEVEQDIKNKNIELIKIESYDKKQVMAKVRIENKEFLLVANNKKKIEEDDLLKANKKAIIFGLPYYILAKGDPSKKLKETIEAHKNLSKIEKMLPEQVS